MNAPIDLLIKDNAYFLEQAIAMLETLDEEEYAISDEDCYGASIGQHFRHCIEYYEAFLVGMPEGVVDYYQRSRNKEIETSKERAVVNVKDVLNKLQVISSVVASQELQVNVEHIKGKPFWHQSSIGRELQFLSSHTLHHYALIGIMCFKRGIAIDKKFGVAPSTLQYQEKLTTT